MLKPASFWKNFLDSFFKKNKNPKTVFFVLKQTSLIEITDKTLTIACPNEAVSSFLQKRSSEIEKELSDYLGYKIKTRFTIIKKRKNRPPPPLLSFQPKKEDLFLKSGVNPKYDFDNFAVSSTNQVAYAAAQAVANNLAFAYNPLFLYGGVGVGKTHLAQAIAKKVITNNSDKKVLFCPGDNFINELIESIKDKTTTQFRRKYRKLNLLIVDDIQFIAGKNHIQEEFFHTFNSILSSGGQIILTSDRPPSEIKNLEDRLRSRFSGGLTVDIQPPDFELRTAILLIKAREKNIPVDIEAAKIIAEKITDTRALEGTIISLYAKIIGKQEKEQIDLETVASFFSEKDKTKIQKITPGDIIRTVCSFYNIKQSKIKGPERSQEIALSRQIVMYLLRRELKMKYKQIAISLKRKDHTTIIHAIKKIERLTMKDNKFKQEINTICQNLYQ